MSSTRTTPVWLVVVSAICLLLGRIALALSIAYGLSFLFLGYHPPQGATRIVTVLAGSLALLAIPVAIAKDPRWFLNVLVYGLCLGCLLFSSIVARVGLRRTPHGLSGQEGKSVKAFHTILNNLHIV